MKNTRTSLSLRRAFTLIELLIVVAIIAILAAIAVPNFLEAQVRAKVSRCKADQRSVAVAIEAYCVDYNQAPNDYWNWKYPTGNGYYLTYFCLTTPVAYIGKIPTDVFAALAATNQTVTNRNTFFYAKTSKNYTASPAPYYDTVASDKTWHQVRVKAWANAEKRGVNWLIASAGPDNLFGGDEISFVHYFGGDEAYRSGNASTPINRCCSPYDPTNGSKSLGRIARTNRGAEDKLVLIINGKTTMNAWNSPQCTCSTTTDAAH